MKYKVLLFGLVLVGIIAARQLWPDQKKAPTDQFTDIVTTSTGDVRGFIQDGLNIYLGIPYAKPPTGSRRFELPEPMRMRKTL